MFFNIGVTEVESAVQSSEHCIGSLTEATMPDPGRSCARAIFAIGPLV
jgi:hypothetical protein